MKTIGFVPELYVTDLARSLVFYQDVLGFKILYQKEEEDFAYLRRENAELMLEQIGESRDWITGDLQRPFGRGLNLQIEVSNVDSLHRQLRAEGITPFLALQEKWYRRDDHFLGNRQFMIQDPDGYLLRFYQGLGCEMRQRTDRRAEPQRMIRSLPGAASDRLGPVHGC